LVAAIAFSATVWAIHYPAVLPLIPISGATQMWYQVLIDVMGLFVVLPAVFGNQLRGTGRHVLRTAPVVFIGTISYGIYLWHFPIIVYAVHRTGHIEVFNFFEITLVTLVLTVAVATASWYILEKPLIRFSHQPRLLQETIGKWLGALSRRRGTEVSEEEVTSLESATAD
jgi:peptidoglycan/LPS O-acetylase OafA/YrhL